MSRAWLDKWNDPRFRARVGTVRRIIGNVGDSYAVRVLWNDNGERTSVLASNLEVIRR